MKNILSCTKTAIILLLATVLCLGVYVYMLARPISYGMSYRNETVYEGTTFEGTLRFYPNGKILSENSNFEGVLEFYYYYRDGYVFTLTAQTDAEYEAEVAYINENFDKAIATPFYASRINAFRQVAVGLDDNVTTYTCTGVIAVAAGGGVALLALIALTATSLALSVKAKGKARD